MSYPGQVFEDPEYYDDADQAWDDLEDSADDEQT